ncbi:zinc-finger domain-containing protein [Aliikangiella sp. IMCC44653]
MENDTKKTASNTIQVKPSELPVCCPPKSQALWNQHPRVYIELNSQQQGECPYCGNEFVLKAE